MSEILRAAAALLACEHPGTDDQLPPPYTGSHAKIECRACGCRRPSPRAAWERPALLEQLAVAMDTARAARRLHLRPPTPSGAPFERDRVTLIEIINRRRNAHGLADVSVPADFDLGGFCDGCGRIPPEDHAPSCTLAPEPP